MKSEVVFVTRHYRDYEEAPSPIKDTEDQWKVSLNWQDNLHLKTFSRILVTGQNNTKEREIEHYNMKINNG